MAPDLQTPKGTKSRTPVPKITVTPPSSLSPTQVTVSNLQSPKTLEQKVKYKDDEQKKRCLEYLKKRRVEREAEQKESDRKNDDSMDEVGWVAVDGDYEIGRREGQVELGWDGKSLEESGEEEAKWNESGKDYNKLTSLF